jgi:hypothetical protein
MVTESSNYVIARPVINSQVRFLHPFATFKAFSQPSLATEEFKSPKARSYRRHFGVAAAVVIPTLVVASMYSYYCSSWMRS